VRERARGTETERVRKLYDREAGRYDTAIGTVERLFLGGSREWVCARAGGEVLEIAAGTGRNLPYYPGDVRITGIELSPEMLEISRRRARELGVEADLRPGDAQALDFPDASFDTVVSTLSLCTIPDDAAAVSEAKRVLRPGGRFLLLEHVESPVAPVRLIQKILNPVTTRLQADHLLREPLRHLAREGFEIEELERSKLGLIECVSARRTENGGESPK
jgi:ubiquinone/menaquinone biosynthesis C-methylase UbiE